METTNTTTPAACYGYTKTLTKAFKPMLKSGRIFMQQTEDGSIYVCNGYLLVKICAREYDELLRPVTGRDPGTYILTNGSVANSHDFPDLPRQFALASPTALLTSTPITITATTGTKHKVTHNTSMYAASDGSFAVGLNPDYDGVLPADFPRKGSSPKSPVLIYCDGEPVALVMPVKMDDSARAAALAYVSAPSTPASDADDTLRRENDALRRAAETLRGENETLRAQLAQAADADDRDGEIAHLRAANEGLRAEIADAETAHVKELEALQDRIAQLEKQLEAAAAAHPSPAPEKQPAKPATSNLVDITAALEALSGVTVTVKGAQTAAPVIWIDCGADAHADEIKALGGRWSGKKSAWYVRA